MSESAVQVIARGDRAPAEAAAAAIDANPLLENATYSILEEDEDKEIWRIDAFPTTDEEAEGIAELIETLQAELREGPSAWLAKAIRRTRGTPDQQRFEAMAGEAWDE